MDNTAQLTPHAIKPLESEENNDEKEGEEEDDGDILEDMWESCDGLGQPDDAPEGSYQECYWTDGMLLCRKKLNGIWKYSTCKE